MPTTKVTRSYQVTIPEEVRSKVGIKVGDTLIMDYDDVNNTIKIRVPARARKTMKLGRDLAVKEIEAAIEKGLTNCLRS